MSYSILKNIQFLSVALFCFMLTGCGGSSGPPLGNVSGTVTLDGKPLEDATVTFYPGEGRSAIGTTDASGNYTLQFNQDRAGAPIGENIVSITTKREPYHDESNTGNDIEGRKEVVPLRYHAKSELKADVKSGSNTFNFDLESGGPTELDSKTSTEQF
ncbi:carboxypeptidase-like regulatory domain-containing protein [Rubinisphaera sp.]|uniref:carboxypeptidase-like regulatory domain-containing protein n=1 Tax=Rubinisphaera sp. TaxID=2024857 RepID=UPI000C0D5753|nr:carboxypeptidase-like regulatory domain-containing protein [Rubinisphaera sp.]MBV07924.1 hypothetical protein [Rubinisphaera sp.]HCS53380.1 hypothetical protein [Planctomycetaceae bacterium]|tara:strand:- start:116 stop:589 length:474 start_codon:yes stop_codon:yes gene_type:complete